MACWRVSMGPAWRYLWLLYSSGPGVPGTAEIRERTQPTGTELPFQGASAVSALIYFVLCATRMWKSTTMSSWFWFKGLQSYRFYSVANGELLKASPVQCCPWLGQGAFSDEGFGSSHRSMLLHLSSVYQVHFIKCPQSSHTTIPLPVLFPPLVMPPLPHLLGSCLLKNHFALSPYLHVLAWGKYPCHCGVLISVMASVMPYYSYGGNAHRLYAFWVKETCPFVLESLVPSNLYSIWYTVGVQWMALIECTKQSQAHRLVKLYLIFPTLEKDTEKLAHRQSSRGNWIKAR